MKRLELAHLDLKHDNLMLDRNLNLKLGDFGFAYHVGGKGE